jgi:hypothetical protein
MNLEELPQSVLARMIAMRIILIFHGDRGQPRAFGRPGREKVDRFPDLKGWAN